MTHLLNSGGIVHIDVPNANSLGAKTRRLHHGDTNWGIIALPHHQIGYYPESLRGLLQRSGLDVLEIVERPTDDGVFGQTILADFYSFQGRYVGRSLSGTWLPVDRIGAKAVELGLKEVA